MTDTFEFRATEAAGAADAATAISLGGCLAEARKARGLTIADVAQVIKYSPRQIEALEHNQFDKLPGVVVVRGFIRNYAKLLQLDATGLLAMFDRQVPTPVPAMELLADTGAGTALPQPGMRGDQFHRSLMLGAALLALSGAVGFYYFWPVAPVPHETQAAAEITVTTMPHEAMAAVAGGADDAGNTPPAPEVAPDTLSGAPAHPEAAVLQPDGSDPAATRGMPQDADHRQLIFSFDDKSWVEVKDATQRTVFAQINLPGTHQVVTGKPPFALVVGNASHVQLQYEDRRVDMQPHTKVDVARFNLE